MRRLLLPLCALLLAACGPSKPRYTFPGCPAPASTDGCNDFQVFACAQETLIAQANGCTADSDCVIVSPRSCAFSCPVAVNASQAGAFRDRMANESARFCASGRCGGEGFGGACAFARAAACDGGRCVPARFTDGG